MSKELAVKNMAPHSSFMGIVIVKAQAHPKTRVLTANAKGVILGKEIFL